MSVLVILSSLLELPETGLVVVARGQFVSLACPQYIFHQQFSTDSDHIVNGLFVPPV